MPSGPVEGDANPFKGSWDFGPLVGSPLPFLSGGATQAPGEERALSQRSWNGSRLLGRCGGCLVGND